MRKFLTFLFLSTVVSSALAQDMDYTREVLNELCSDELAGRGYVEDGDNATAYYLEQELQGMDVPAWNYNYYQQFAFPINTFPGKMEMRVDEDTLIPGKHFQVEPDAPSIKGSFQVMELAELPELAPSGRIRDSTARYDGFVVLADSLLAQLPPSIRLSVLRGMKKAGAIGVIRLAEEKLTWGVSKQQAPLPQMTVLRSFWPKGATTVELNVEAEFRRRHRTQNVIAFVEGYAEPDSFVVFTAHYDHLGKMGSETIFRGANDNASGVAMLLNLAKYYAEPENTPRFSIAFMAFAGEEAGLEGSFHYVRKPIFPLKNIRFLVNLDILGTGDEGITVVNGSVHPKEFHWLVSRNDEGRFISDIKKRGKAAISDHYPFSEAGVPCFYVYTRGGIKAYHDVYDVPETLPLTGFQGIFLLLTEFVKTF